MSVQQEDDESLLNHYRRVIALRQARIALATGEMEIVETGPTLLGFWRRSGRESIYCLFNLSKKTVEADLPAGEWRDIGAPVGGAPIPRAGKIRLDGWQCAIALDKGG